MTMWWTSPPPLLQIHSLHQVAMDTPSHVPLQRRAIIITILPGSGTNCMVPSGNCGPNFRFILLENSPSFFGCLVFVDSDSSIIQSILSRTQFEFSLLLQRRCASGEDCSMNIPDHQFVCYFAPSQNGTAGLGAGGYWKTASKPRKTARSWQTSWFERNCGWYQTHTRKKIKWRLRRGSVTHAS